MLVHGAVHTRKPLRVELPKEESVRLGRVGVIAIVGFAAGILWPRLAGMRLVPSVPTEKTETTSAELSGAPVDAAAPSAAAAPAPAPPPQPAKPAFTIGPGQVVSCRDDRGKRVERCDGLEFDALARPRIETLSACPTAERAEGVLSLGFELDFKKDRVLNVESGKRTSLPQADVDGLLACVKQNLGEISLSGIRHQQQRYWIFYRVEFASDSSSTKKGSAAAVADVDVTPASGKATVAWDVALVRASPSRDNDVVARVLQGTRVIVTGRHGDWYRIKYDVKGAEGWVFRTAIGM